MKAVLRRVANTRCPWTIACDANVEPMQLRLGECFSEVKALAWRSFDVPHDECGKIKKLVGFWITPLLANR